MCPAGLSGHSKWASLTIISPAKWSTTAAENFLSFEMIRVFYPFPPDVHTWVVWWSGTEITICSYAHAMGENTMPRGEMWRVPRPVRWINLPSDLMIMDFLLWIRILL